MTNPARKRVFEAHERFAVWEAHDGVCFWCDRPVEFASVTIDHVLPESLETRHQERQQALEQFGLGPEFQINSFTNWVPAHPRCNSSKGKRVFTTSPAMIKALDDTARRAVHATAVFQRFEKDKASAKVIAMLERARDAGTVTLADVRQVFKAIADVPAPAAVAPKSTELFINGRWRVARRHFSLLEVTDGVRYGAMPAAPNPDPSWFCSFCGNPGPWDGIICLSCNQRSEPD